jgi:DNA-binding GntR family transcriptional regulator
MHDSENKKRELQMSFLKQAPIEKQGASLTSQIYETLKQDILRGTLAPGRKLRIDELKELYGIGASAIREALSLLTSERLVRRIDQRGFRVAPISRHEFDELLKTRCWLEQLALREAIRCGNASWEESVVLANFHLTRTRRDESEERLLANDAWEAQHKSFHRTLIGACNSDLMLTFCDQMYDLNIRYRRVVGSLVEGGRDVEDEHTAIVQAALARDVDKAAALLLAHYHRTADSVRAKL